MPWTDTFDDETRAAAAAKGWDRLDGDAAARAIFKSYTNLERTRPAADTIIGPRNPTEYNFEGITFGDKPADAEFTAYARQLATDLKLPPATARELAQRLATEGHQAETTAAEAAQKAIVDGTGRLQAAWGDKYEGNTAIASNAFEALKMPKETVDNLISVMGVDKVMEMGHALGSRMGEAKLLTGGGMEQKGTMTREEALTKRNQLTSDPVFGKKIMEGDTEALKTLEDLGRAILGDPNGQWAPPPENFGRTKDNPTGTFETSAGH